MTPVLLIILSLAASVILGAGLIAYVLRTLKAAKPSSGHPRDSEIHSRRAQTQVEVEERDIDDMLDAIAEYRRRAGRREIGEELADEILRSTWGE